MRGKPRYIQKVPVDFAGTVDANALPEQLPYGLTPRAFFRMVEDVHDLLHDLNSTLHDKSYQRLEELHEPAGFSGLLSKTVATRLASATRMLTLNRYHNGYPDLIVRGQYPQDAVARGEGGLEIKATRSETNWQSHGPRAGWFAFVRFELDERTDVATYEREPTRVRAVMVAELEEADWSWQPAHEGRIRSGTASVRASGMVKLRAGAVWVDPDYQSAHQELLEKARLNLFRGDNATELVANQLQVQGEMSAGELADALGSAQGIPPNALKGRIQTALKRLKESGRIVQDSGGRRYQLRA